MYNRPDATNAAIALASASPLAGDYMVILLAALLGSLVALSRYPTETRISGALFIFRSVAIAFAITWVLAIWASKFTGLDIAVILFPVAFGVGLIGDGWFAIKDKLIDKFTK